MNCVVALDLSEKPGFAVYQDGKLVRHGTIFNTWEKKNLGGYPYNYFNAASLVLEAIVKEVLVPEIQSRPEKLNIVVEETTGSHNNYSQKILEFIHYRMIETMRWMRHPEDAPGLYRDLADDLDVPEEIEINYIRTGVWRSKVGAVQTKEERNYNAKISRQKKKKKETFIKENPGVEKVPNFRAKLDVDGSGKAKVVRRLDEKDYALRVVRERFGLELTYEQNDTADAICLGLAFIEGVPLCDGTTTGGVNGSDKEGSPGETPSSES